MKKSLIRIVRSTMVHMESEIETDNYSQFTVDFIQDALVDINESLEEQSENEQTNLAKSIQYKIENIIEIMKDSLDLALLKDAAKMIKTYSY